MSYTYAVLGSGRQGTAAAYDMARFGDAKEVLLGDVNITTAQKSAERINNMIGKEIVSSHQIDVTNHAKLKTFLTTVDSFLSAVPYWYNLAITQAAIEAKACMTDLGGNTDIVRDQIKLSLQAIAADVAIIPDCGQVPGMASSLTAYAMTLLDKTDEVMIWDGGNALHPKPPFNYILTFHIAGLTNEYYGFANFIRNGEIVQVPTFQEEDYETVEFPDPIGKMEAFVAGGGTSTMPWTYQGKLKTLWNKTLRWPGHFVQWKAFMDGGLLEEEPIEIQGVKVSPREVLHTLMEPRIRAKPGEPDIVIVRVLAKGQKNNRQAQVLLDMIDRFDSKTGFTAMERSTGWDGSIKAILNAQGITPRGVNPAELAVPGALYVAELRKRNLSLSEKVTIE
jgi:lysine 6-dehydrogenase